MSKEKLQFYIEEELRISLEEYIILNDLDKKKIDISKLCSLIVHEWMEEPILNSEDIFYKYIEKNTKRKRTTISLTEDETIQIKRIFVKDYIRKIFSVNMLVVNIIEQWAIKNIRGYSSKTILRSREVC